MVLITSEIWCCMLLKLIRNTSLHSIFKIQFVFKLFFFNFCVFAKIFPFYYNNFGQNSWVSFKTIVVHISQLIVYIWCWIWFIFFSKKRKLESFPAATDTHRTFIWSWLSKYLNRYLSKQINAPVTRFRIYVDASNTHALFLHDGFNISLFICNCLFIWVGTCGHAARYICYVWTQVDHILYVRILWCTITPKRIKQSQIQIFIVGKWRTFLVVQMNCCCFTHYACG